jgi:hypothetical protein
MQTTCITNDINIDDLARLAREACVYRGRSQSANTRVSALRRLRAFIGKGFLLFKSR